MIRKANENDAARIAEIQVFGWRTAYRGIINDQFLYNSLSVIKSAEGILKRIKENDDKIQIYVFEEDNIIKGFFIAGPYRDNDENYKDDSTLELYAIYVEPSMKRLGIGSKMINFLENYAKENSFKKITLWVLEKNYNGRNFYKKNGFIANKKKKENDWFNATEIEYEKRLEN